MKKLVAEFRDLPPVAALQMIAEDCQRSGTKVEVGVRAKLGKFGQGLPFTLVIGKPQPVMFAIGAIAANGEDCLVSVKEL